MTRLSAFVLATLLCLSPLSAQAQDLSGLSKQERADTLRFAVNNALFTLYHEVGHLLIDKLGLPVLGKEEDAADNIATWMLLEKRTPDANRTLEDAVDGWVLTGLSYDNYFEGQDYVSGYSPDRHRAMQIACLMVGADGAAFRPMARAYDIPEERQQTCFYDYELMDQALDGLLSDAGTGTRVEVTYHDGGVRLRLAERVLRGSGIVDTVAEEVREGYRINGRVKFTAKRCGEANAYYDTATTEVIFCYELMEEFMQLYVDDLSHR